MEKTANGNNNLMFKYAAYYGMIIGLVLIIFTTVDYAFKIYGQNKFLTTFTYVVLIAGIYVFTTLYRDKVLGGYMSYGQSVSFGILLIVFASIISGIFTFVLNIVDPSYMATQFEMMADQMAQKGLGEAQIDQMMSISSKFNSPVFTLLSAVFGGILLGAVFSLVTSIFTKKAKSIF